MIGKLKALVAGFVLGILVAPRSGRASRRLLMERLNEFFDAGTRQLEELEDELAGRRDVHRSRGAPATEAAGAEEGFDEP